MSRDEINDTSQAFHVDAEFLGRHFAAIARHDVLGPVFDGAPVGLGGDGDNDMVVEFFPIVDGRVEKDAVWVSFFSHTTKNGLQSQKG